MGMGLMSSLGFRMLACLLAPVLFLGACSLTPYHFHMIDSDRDGVANRDDQCPQTPRGARVDVRGCEIDTDGDGVADGIDRCPGTQAGRAVDYLGCELDTDCDGVPDPVDECPATVFGATVDARGCAASPIVDTDGDGVLDPDDHCPATPAGERVDTRGCTLPEVITLQDVIFDFDSSTLTGEAEPRLREIAEVMQRYPELHAGIHGHTDSRGSVAYNMALSQARAERVRDYLVTLGIDRTRFRVRAAGEHEPVDTNETDAGRQRNRRVEIRFVDGGPPGLQGR